MTKANTRGLALPDMVQVGDFLFRWRSFLPLLLLPVVVVGVAHSRFLFPTHNDDLEWEFACVALSLAGLALRMWTVGVAARGTSGRNTRHQKATSLNTTGPYSLVRHPLYVANGIIVVSWALFLHGWIAPLVVSVFTLAYYGCIAWREEQFLSERFGPAFEEWAAGVPAMMPAVRRYAPPARRFQWTVAIRREFYAASLILISPFFLDLAEDFQDTGELVLDPVWSVTAVLGVLLFVVVRYLKKHTSVLTVAPDA
jgi:protein-S-isoprenylcysteine O-methyltransferase Ste14